MMAAPYRTLLAIEDQDYTPPLRAYYGTDDANYSGGSYLALQQQSQRLGISWQEEIAPGFGHNTWPEATIRDGFAFLLGQRYGSQTLCKPSAKRLCLRDGRFAIEARWRDFENRTGSAQVADERRSDSGLLWFFRADNWEVMVKVLDGCALNGHFWFFLAAATNVEYTVTVRDLGNGTVKEYTNPLRVHSPALADIELSPCS
jgi:hypothetical protein